MEELIKKCIKWRNKKAVVSLIVAFAGFLVGMEGLIQYGYNECALEDLKSALKK